MVQNDKDNEHVSKFAARVDVLITMASDEDVIKSLKDLKNKIEYLSVSPKKEVISLDKKIGDALDDLKILISKSKEKEDVLGAIKEIQVKIKHRETIY